LLTQEESALRKQSLTSSERLRRKAQARAGSAGGSPEAGIENIIVIGASAGGHAALIEVLRPIADDIPAAIVIVLHRPETSVYKLEESLARFTRLPLVSVGKSKQLRHGVAFIPPPGRAVSLKGGMIRVESGERTAVPVTTINCLFQEAARRYGRRVIGLVLTGLLRDGTAGLQAVHAAGGLTMVQNPLEAQYPDMPASAMKNLSVTFCLNLSEIGPALDLLARRGTRLESGVAVSVRLLKERVALMVRLIEQSKRNRGTVKFLDRELATLKQDLDSIQSLLREVEP
jgi:two-component system chemotaxis response regulator CheB